MKGGSCSLLFYKKNGISSRIGEIAEEDFLLKLTTGENREKS